MDGKENSILLALRQIISAVSLKSSFEEAIASLVEKIRSTMHSDCCSLYLLKSYFVAVF